MQPPNLDPKLNRLKYLTPKLQESQEVSDAKSHFDSVRTFGSAGEPASSYVGKRSTERMVLSA